jgi:hypothetical protein
MHREADNTRGLSAQEILTKLLAATRDVGSFQTESETTIRSGGNTWWTKFLRLRVGPDEYRESTSSERPDRPLMSLFFNGVQYTKDPHSDEWVSRAPSRWDATDHRAASDFTRAGRPDGDRAHMIYAIWFGAVTNLDRLSDKDVGDQYLLRLRGGYDTEASFPAAALWPKHVEPENDPGIDLEATGSIDLWIDSPRLLDSKDPGDPDASRSWIRGGGYPPPVVCVLALQRSHPPPARCPTASARRLSSSYFLLPSSSARAFSTSS